MKFSAGPAGIRRVAQDTGALGKGDQFREGLDLHLLHHPVAMSLDRSLGCAQNVADLLVGLAANDEIKDFAFARRQRRNSRAHRVELVSLATRCQLVRESSPDRGKKIL